MKQFVIFHKIALKKIPKMMMLFTLMIVILVGIYMIAFENPIDKMDIGLILKDDSEQMQTIVNLLQNEKSLSSIAELKQIEENDSMKEYDVVLEIEKDFFRNLDLGNASNLKVSYMKDNIQTQMLSQLMYVVKDVINMSWASIKAVGDASEKYGANASDYEIMNKIAFNYAGKILMRKATFNDIYYSVFGQVTKNQHLISLGLLLAMLFASIFMSAFYRKDLLVISAVKGELKEGFFARLFMISEGLIICGLIYFILFTGVDNYISISNIDFKINLISILDMILVSFSLAVFINLIFLAGRKKSNAAFIIFLTILFVLSVDAVFMFKISENPLLLFFNRYFPSKYWLDLINYGFFDVDRNIFPYAITLGFDILIMYISYKIYDRRMQYEVI